MEARAFYAHFDFEVSPTDPLHLMLLIKDARESRSPHKPGTTCHSADSGNPAGCCINVVTPIDMEIDALWRDTALAMPQENWDIGLRWLKGDFSFFDRLPDAIRLAGVMVTGVVSRRPVRPLGDEARRPFPGDELVPAKMQQTHGVTIEARPSDIWPWLIQMGCRRAGVYSYDRLDNGGVPSADRIIPEFQHIEVGDILPWTPTAEDGFIVRAVEPERALVLGEDSGSFTWAFVLEPINATSTRLLARARSWYESLAGGLMVRLVWRPVHFGMQRRQLLNIMRRVEAAAAAESR